MRPVLVLHQVDVVVARADRAELRLGELGELALRREVGSADLRSSTGWSTRSCAGTPMPNEIRRVISPIIALDAAERVEVGPRQLGARRLVAAADVVADARRRDVALVGDAAADRLAVARVVVGAEDAELGVARLHAALELLEAPLVDRAERLDVHVVLLSFCRAQRHRADSNRRVALCRRAPRRSATVS